MFPHYELERLVQALKNTPEYQKMNEAGKTLFSNTELYKKMLEFEKEQSRLQNIHTTDKSLSEEMEKLRGQYGDLFRHEDTISFIDATSRYREIIEGCLDALEKTFDL